MRRGLLVAAVSAAGAIVGTGPQRCADAVTALHERIVNHVAAETLTIRITCRDPDDLEMLARSFEQGAWRGWAMTAVVNGRLIGSPSGWWRMPRCGIAHLAQPVRYWGRYVLVGSGGRVEGIDVVPPPVESSDSPMVRDESAPRVDPEPASARCRTDPCPT